MRLHSQHLVSVFPVKTWGGKPENREKAQKVFMHRAKMNGLAAKGEYDRKLENEA